MMVTVGSNFQQHFSVLHVCKRVKRIIIKLEMKNIKLDVLFFYFSFTGSVKLKGVIIIGGEDDTHPSEMRL